MSQSDRNIEQAKDKKEISIDKSETGNFWPRSCIGYYCEDKFENMKT